MSDHRKILKLIRRIRESHPEMVMIFTQGSCLNFHAILRGIFPGAEAWTDNDHVVTKIGDRFYDITGEISVDEGFCPLKNFLWPQYKNLGVAKTLMKEQFPLKEKSA